MSNPSLSVTPSVARVDLATDAPVVTLVYANTTSVPVDLELSTEASWLDLGTVGVHLNAGESRGVKVYIRKDSLAPGGYYANILAVASGEGNIRTGLSSVIFVRTNTGQEVEKGEIVSWWSDGREFGLKFNNLGNVDVVPYGRAEITGMWQDRIGFGILNEGSLTVLPGAIREYNFKVQDTPVWRLPGWYTASIAVHYGKGENVQTAQAQFFTLGSVTLGMILVLIMGVIVLGSLARKLRKKK